MKMVCRSVGRVTSFAVVVLVDWDNLKTNRSRRMVRRLYTDATTTCENKR